MPLAGKILVGNDYSFAKVAAPYANELLSLQNARTFALDEFGKQVLPPPLIAPDRNLCCDLY